MLCSLVVLTYNHNILPVILPPVTLAEEETGVVAASAPRSDPPRADGSRIESEKQPSHQSADQPSDDEYAKQPKCKGAGVSGVQQKRLKPARITIPKSAYLSSSDSGSGECKDVASGFRFRSVTEECGVGRISSFGNEGLVTEGFVCASVIIKFFLKWGYLGLCLVGVITQRDSFIPYRQL